MKPSSRTTIVVAALAAGLIGVALLGPRIAVDAASSRRGFEAAASNVVGSPVTVEGRFAIAFTGDVLFVMRDVLIHGTDGAEIPYWRK
jgi:hypothetical protein